MRALKPIPPPKYNNERHEASVLLLRASSLFNEHVRKFLEPYDLTQQQFNVLRILRGARPDALSTGDVKARMIDTTCDISRLVARMEKKLLIEKKSSEADRRLVELFITQKGLLLLSDIDLKMDEIHSYLDGMGDEEIQLLNTCLKSLLVSNELEPEAIETISEPVR